MQQSHDVRLADYTTLRVGGTARDFVDVDTDDDLIAVVGDADTSGVDVLMLGGGSNVVIGDEGFAGCVVHVNTTGSQFERSDDDRVDVTAAAGVPWDDVVARCVGDGLSGIETLSGIPGSVGATPIQNIGAYGREIADVITGVRAFDRRDRQIVRLEPQECGFGYRTSRFKSAPDRHVVLSVSMRLSTSGASAAIRYAELATRLGVEIGASVSTSAVRDAVLELRRGKGMVLDEFDHDTWSVGSFFTNPVLDASTVADLPDQAPRWLMSDGRFKTSAAWLIEAAGFERGFSLISGSAASGTARATGIARATETTGAAVSTKHTLALVNRGQASTRDVLELARVIRDGVSDRFGVRLDPEPTLVGCSL